MNLVTIIGIFLTFVPLKDSVNKSGTIDLKRLTINTSIRIVGIALTISSLYSMKAGM